MTDTPVDVSDLDDTTALEQLVLEDIKLADAEAHIKERRTQIRAVLATRLPGDGTHHLAGRKVIVSTPGRLDAKAIERDYPIAKFPHLYAAAVDTKAVRANLPPAVVADQYTTPGARQVRIS